MTNDLYKLTTEQFKKKYLEEPDARVMLEHLYFRGPFIQIPHRLFDNQQFLDEFFYTRRSRLYFFLRRHIVRGKNIYDFLDIYKMYWKKGLLAASPQIFRIQKKLGMPESTIRDQVNWLEEKGIIIVDRYDASETPDKKPRQVYILGTIQEGIEMYFLNDVYLRNVKPELPDDEDE
jgi:hypothetical protein